MLVSLHAKTPQMALYSSQAKDLLLYISQCIIFLDSPWGIISGHHSISSRSESGFFNWPIYICIVPFSQASHKRLLFTKFISENRCLFLESVSWILLLISGLLMSSIFLGASSWLRSIETKLEGKSHHPRMNGSHACKVRCTPCRGKECGNQI